jgi:PilZ domain
MVQIPVKITAVFRGIRSDGTTVDLGIGGGACELDTPLRLGEAIEIEFGTKPVRIVHGEVAWVGWAESSAVRLGVRFDNEDAEELAAILDALGVAA